MSQPQSTSAPPHTVKTRVLIISDTHSAPLAEAEPSGDDNGSAQGTRAFRQPLPKADVLLHCGDLTMAGLLHEYDAALDMLGQIDAELKLVIAGNHDISLDKHFYLSETGGRFGSFRNGERMHMGRFDEQMPDLAAQMWKGEKAKAKGVTYLDEGLHEFTLKNGAKFTVYASPYQPEFCRWAFPYQRHEDRFNPPHLSDPEATNIAVNPVPEDAQGKIDIMMTHGPLYRRLDRTSSRLDVGCKHLLRAVARARPRLHACGHIHEAWGVERVKWSGEEGAAAGAGVIGMARKVVGAIPGVGGAGAANEEEEFVSKVEKLEFGDDDVAERHAAFVDVSGEGQKPLEVGDETLLVNASIMDLQYKPSNAPVLVDLDLPKVDG